ncbi:MAG: conjugal transfer protein TraU [Betaproteobacteria bacterium]|nr:MAG: conjugal transfer protein TraU [Betaproteobacteria bacterium]
MTHLLSLRRFVRLVALVALLVLPFGPSLAQTTTTSSSQLDMTCPDSDMFGPKLFTDVCWSCLFPIRLLGMNIGTGDRPTGASNRILCSCDNALGIPVPGIAAGMWTPARLVEIVRKPYCSPTLGGRTLYSNARLYGGRQAMTLDGNDKSFYQYHYFAFPLFAVMELFVQPSCNAGGYTNLDLMYMSELDPTWNNDVVAFFLNPEAALFANPIAVSACAADCTAASVGVNTGSDSMFWCAGCWGHLYPFTGNLATKSSPPRDTSLLATKATAALHRRGLAWKTFGNDALCGGYIYPMIPKSQYRMSMMYPIAEASGKCCHPIGQSTFLWGEWRNIPAVGEDFVYMLWRYTDCCLN